MAAVVYYVGGGNECGADAEVEEEVPWSASDMEAAGSTDVKSIRSMGMRNRRFLDLD